MSLSLSQIRFLWSGKFGTKIESGRVSRLFDAGPASNNTPPYGQRDAIFATAGTRPVWDNLQGWFGAAVDPTSTNQLRNNSMQGAVAGSPGTLPTFWEFASLAGLTSQVVGVGVENGIEYIDIRLHGTAAATGLDLRVDGSALYATSAGTTWTVSVFLKLVAAPNPFDSFSIGWGRFTSGVFDSIQVGPVTVTNSLVRVSRSATVGGTSNQIRPRFTPNLTIGQSYDFTIRIGLPQMEQSPYATTPKRTTGSAVSVTANVAQIPDAIPTTGTILIWTNMVNAYATGPVGNRVFDSEDLSASFFSLFKNATNQNQLTFRGHNNTQVSSADLEWQPSNRFKRWFFAVAFDGTNVDIWRGDVQGNLSKVLDTTYTVTTQQVRDLLLGQTPTGDGQVGNSYLDVLTVDAVLTEQDITDIYYGRIPVLQQTAYDGTFVDRHRQKVQAEPGNTYDTTDDAAIYSFWNREL